MSIIKNIHNSFIGSYFYTCKKFLTDEEFQSIRNFTFAICFSFIILKPVKEYITFLNSSIYAFHLPLF